MRRLTSRFRSSVCFPAPVPWTAALLIAALVLAATAMAATPKTDEASETDSVADEVISLPLRHFGIVIDREGKGVYIPYSELMKLWQLAREKAGEPEPVPPTTFVIRSARLDGTLEGETIALTATIEVELLTDEWTFVELGLNGIAVSRALDGDGPLAFRKVLTTAGPRSSKLVAQKGKVAELRGKGPHTLTIEGLVPLDEKGTHFTFTIPKAAMSLVELSVPAGRTLEIEGALLTGSKDADGMTKHAFLLGSASAIRGTLSAADEEPKAPGVLYARTDTLVGFRHDVVETVTRITATVRHKPIEAISVLVPPDVNVTSVTGDAVSEWDVRPTVRGQRVTIRLTRRVVSRVTLELHTEAFYDRTDTTLDVPIPVVENATDSRGFIGVGRAPTARVFVASTTGIVRSNRIELALKEASVVSVYRFRQHPARMTLGLEWPTRRFRVFDTTLLDLQRDVLRLDGVLTIMPVEGAIFDLDITLPPRYEVLDVAGAPGGIRSQKGPKSAGGFKVEWDVEKPDRPGAQRILHVRLPHKIAPPQALILVINARKLPQADLAWKERDARVTEPLGGFIVIGAERQTGTIGIAADPSYLVEDEATSGLVPAPIEELNAAGIAGAGLRFGYTYRRPPFAANLVISKKRPLVETATATTVAVHGDVIDVLALSEFSISYSTLGEILLRLPARVDPDNVEITGDDIRDRHRLTDEEKRALGEEAGGHIWRITLDVGKSGVYVLSVAYQVRIGKRDATNWIPLPDYGPMPDVEADRGFVAVIANREIELGTKIADERLREMDKADLPMRLFPSTPVARVLFAYQYPKPPKTDEALGLVVKRHEKADVLRALVEEADIVVCVSRDHGAFIEARYKALNNEEPALRMRLPARSELWSVLVEGNEIKPRERKDPGGIVYVIPIHSTTSPGQSQEVIVRYRSPMARLKRGGGAYTVTLPTFEKLRVGRAKLVIFQPDEYRFVRFGGNMNLKAEVKRLPLLVRWFRSADEELQAQALVLGRAREQARRGLSRSWKMRFKAGKDTEMEEADGLYAADEKSEEGEMKEERAKKPPRGPGKSLEKKGAVDVTYTQTVQGSLDELRPKYTKGMVRGLLSLDIAIPVEGIDVPFDRLSGGGEVVVRYASSNGMGRTQTIAIVLTLLVGYWLRKLFRWSRTGLVLFLAAVCTIGPGLSNYWTTPYWDMVMKGVLLLIPVFVVDYVVVRIGRRRLAGAAAVVLLIALVAPSAWAKQPAEPAAVIEEGDKRIYVPFTQVDKALLGDDVKDVGVFIPLDEFIRLWERAYPETVRTKPPRDYALTNAVYRGRIGEKRAAFTASFDVAILNDTWTAVPLAFGAVTIEKATLDGAEAPLTILNGTPTLVFEKAGRHKLVLEFKRPVSGVIEQGSLRLAMPPVEAALLEIEAPIEELEFRTDAASRRGATVQREGSTTYRLPVGGLTRLAVSWRRKGLARTVGRAIFHHDGTTRLYVDERLVLGELSSKVTLVRGQLEGLLYDVPSGATILNVAGEGLADWKLEKADDGSVLAVEFAQPVTSQAQLVIDLACDHPGLGKPIAFPDVRLRGAQSDRGSVELHARHGLDLAITDSTGLEPKLRPSGKRTLTETGLTYEPRLARTYPRRPFSLTFEARRIPDDWTATVHTLYTVLEPRLLLESRFRLVPQSGSIFEVLVKLPAGFEVIEISGQQVADWRMSQKQLATVRLRNEQTGPFDVRLVAERLHDEMPEALDLGSPRVSNAVRYNGILAVAFDRAWDIVEPQHAEGMHAIRVGETPGWMRPAGGAEVRFAARYRDDVAPEVAFSLRQSPTRLGATLAHHLSVFNDEVSLRVLVAYSVDGKPVRELKFTAPAELRDELRVVGTELRGPGKQTDVTADGRDVWTVEFHSPVDTIASFEVRWRGEIPAGGTLEIPRIGAVDAGVQTVFATVENLSANEVTAITEAGLTALPVEQVPVVPPDTRLSTIVLAYRSVEPEWKLGLSVVSYEAQKLIEAQILSTTLETVVDAEGEARTKMTLLVRNRTHQFLHVTFPEEIELWALSVASEPAQPSRASAKDGDAYLFPLIKTGLADLPFEVVAIYGHRIGGKKRQPGKRLAWSGSFRLAAPRIKGLPTNKTVWKLWLPQRYRTLGFGGNMEQIEETLSKVEELEVLTEEYERQQILAERTMGKRQRRAIENLQDIERRYKAANVAIEHELRFNEALLQKDGKAIREARNIGRDAFARQQALSREKLKSSTELFKATRHRAQEITIQAEAEQQAKQQLVHDEQITTNYDLSNWGTNRSLVNGVESKELLRARSLQDVSREERDASQEPIIRRKTLLEDKSDLLKSNLEQDEYSNAGFFLDTNAREVQRRLGGVRYWILSGSAGVTLDYDDKDAGEVLGKQKGYTAHEMRVTTQAFRPGIRSLEFDIPREGRLFVFSKLNADAELEARQLRAGTLHGLKTVVALAALALLAWAVEKVRIAERVRRLFEGRRVFGTFVALTALLALVVLIGRFRYGLMNTVLVLAAIAWAIHWFARRRARAPKAPLVEGEAPDEKEDEKQE